MFILSSISPYLLPLLVTIAIFSFLNTNHIICATQKPKQLITVYQTTTLDQKKLISREPDLDWLIDHATAQHVIDIDDSVAYQQIDGFGAILSDSSAWLLHTKLNESKRKQLLTSLFDRQIGIGLGMVQISIGASAFSLTNYTYDNTCCELGDFSISHDQDYVIPILKSILELNPDVKIMATCWSPPAWMKSEDGSATSAGQLIGGRLRQDEQSNMASYLSKFVMEYEKQGVPIYALVPQRDPDYSAPCCYPSMKISALEQSELISARLGKAFRKQKINTKIILASQSWDDLSTYGEMLLANETTLNYVSGLALNCYRGSPTYQTIFRRKYPQKDLWLTECTDEILTDNNGKVVNTESELFRKLFRRTINREIIGAFRNGARGIFKGNLALDEKNGPQNGGCKNCLGMVTLNGSEISRNSAFYAFGHLSKFLRNGAKRILSTSLASTIETIAFENNDGEKVLFVYNNLKEWPVPFKARWGHESFAYTIPPYSAVTFTWRGASVFRSAFDRIEAESFSDSFGIVSEACNDESGGCGEQIANTDFGDYLVYKNLDFGHGAKSVTLRTASLKSALVAIHLNRLDGPLVEAFVTDNTTSYSHWETKTVSVNVPAGVYDLYFTFRGNGEKLCNLNWFVFGAKNERKLKNDNFVIADEKGAYKIVAAHSNLALDAGNVETRDGESRIKQWEFYYVEWQKFYFLNYRNNGGCFKIYVQQNSHLLEMRDDADADIKAGVYRSKDRNLSSQAWRITNTDDGYVRIETCLDSGKVFQIKDGGREQGAVLEIGTRDEQKTEQKFSLVLMETVSTDVDKKFHRDSSAQL